MIVSVVHDPDTQTVTIIVGSKTVTFAYQGNLPPGWEADPSQYESALVNLLNRFIEERKDRRAWLRDRGFKTNDPIPFSDSERIWLDTNTDEVVFMDAIVKGATWSSERNQFLIHVQNTLSTNPRG